MRFSVADVHAYVSLFCKANVSFYVILFSLKAIVFLERLGDQSCLSRDLKYSRHV